MSLRRSCRVLLVIVSVPFAVSLAISPAIPAGPETPTKPATPPSKAGGSKAASQKAPAAAEKAPAADPNVPEKEFTVTFMSGPKVKATIFPNPTRPGKVVRFDPPVPQTDVNLHSVSLKSMWEIYGPQRGSFKMEDGRLEPRADLNTNIMVYRLKTGAKFCVSPVRDDTAKTFSSIKVWME